MIQRGTKGQQREEFFLLTRKDPFNSNNKDEEFVWFQAWKFSFYIPYVLYIMDEMGKTTLKGLIKKVAARIFIWQNRFMSFSGKYI